MQFTEVRLSPKTRTLRQVRGTAELEYKHPQQGVTLLELLLALAIIVMLLVVSIRLYRSYRLDVAANQIQANVNTIFEGMQLYYQANCYGQMYSLFLNNQPVPGTLNPSYSPAPSNPYPINIQTNLYNAGYLRDDLITTSPTIIEIDSSTANAYKGYVAQFNQQTAAKNVVVTTPAGGQTWKTVGQIVFWQLQVAAQLPDNIANDKAAALAYLMLLNGNCLSSLQGNVVAPCTAGNLGTGSFVVWVTTPTGFTTANFPETGANVNVMQFTQQYRTSPGSYLLGTGGTVGTSNTTQYYYCGN